MQFPTLAHERNLKRFKKLPATAARPVRGLLGQAQERQGQTRVPQVRVQQKRARRRLVPQEQRASEFALRGPAEPVKRRCYRKAPD